MDITTKELVEILETKGRIFLTGQAGVGKTTLINSLKDEYPNQVRLGTTGISSLLIGGQTLHSFFRIGISKDLNELESYDSWCLINSKKPNMTSLFSYNIYLMNAVDLIIIDEISMASGDLLDIIFKRLSQFGATDRLGKPDVKIILSGDLLQLPPVKAKNYVFDSKYFKTFTPIFLTKVKRTTDLKFIQILNKIRVGVVDSVVIDYLANLSVPKPHMKPENFTRLYSLNKDVEDTNIKFLEKYGTGETFTSKAVVTYNSTYAKEQDVEDFFKNSKAKKDLDVRVGASVMFIKNTDDYVNGDTGKILNIDEKAGIISIEKSSSGEVVHLGRINFEKISYKLQNGSIISDPIITIRQFPIILAFAISIHKSQGMSIKNLFINCNGIFERHQFYVALSRAISPDSLVLRGFDPRHVIIDERVLEYYKQLADFYDVDTES